MGLASFDVFDTVLVRTCAEPRDLFLLLGERLAARHSDSPTPAVFAAERMRAEAEARRQHGGNEIQLADIYTALAARLQWDESRRSEAQELEVVLEGEALRVVPAQCAAIAAARRAGERIVFISDMYLPADAIQRWLESAGCWQPGDRLFVSSAAGATKGSGALYAHIREALGANFAAWTHVGDHPVSDLARPREHGITARLCQDAQLNVREQRLRGPAEFAPVWRSQLAGAARLARLDRPAAGSDVDQADAAALWATGADVAGPLFHDFTAWTLAEAEQRGLTDLFFLARGGQIFHRIAREILAARPRPLRLHYLPVSRLALSGTGADRPEPLREVVASTLRFHSARQAYALLGLEFDAAPAPPWLPPEEAGRNLLPEERERLADWLLGPDQWPRARAALEQRRESARAYLAQQGLRADGRVGLVDTGWTGTIQRHLEGVLGPAGTPAGLTGFYLGLNARPAHRCTGPAMAYGSLLSRVPGQRVETARVIVELMARADHGLVLGYTPATDATEPRLAPLPEVDVRRARFFQEAVLAFTRHALASGTDAGDRSEMTRVAEDAFADFCAHPTNAEALAFGRMPHSDQLLEQDYAQLCPPLQTGEIVSAIFQRRRRPAPWWLEGQATFGHAPLLRAYLALKKAKWWWQARAR